MLLTDGLVTQLLRLTHATLATTDSRYARGYAGSIGSESQLTLAIQVVVLNNSTLMI